MKIKQNIIMAAVALAALFPAITTFACYHAHNDPCHVAQTGTELQGCDGTVNGSVGVSGSGPSGSVGGTVNWKNCPYTETNGQNLPHAVNDVAKGDTDKTTSILPTKCKWTRTFAKSKCCPSWSGNVTEPESSLVWTSTGNGDGGCPAPHGSGSH